MLDGYNPDFALQVSQPDFASQALQTGFAPQFSQKYIQLTRPTQEGQLKSNAVQPPAVTTGKTIEKSMADFLPHLRLSQMVPSFEIFSRSASASMEALPTELTMDILSRLRVKTIIHCKLVCKKWRNLDSSFVNLYLSRSPIGLIIHQNCHISMIDPGILKWVEIEDQVDHHHLHYDHRSNLDLNLAPILQKTRTGHVGSVNGLICLWQYSPKVDNAYICNPVTREYMILPRQRLQTIGLFGRILYGFGVSSLMGEYKVVWAFQREIQPNAKKPSQPSELEVEVYTLGTGQWRSLGPVPVSYWLDPFCNFYGPFLNNHCHWIVYDNEDAHEKICTFDFDRETFQLFPSPKSVKENRFLHQRLAILKGCLCKLEKYKFELTIWVMKEYGIKNLWHKEVVVRLEISDDLKWESFKPIHLIAGLKDGSILMVVGNKLCVFDPQNETIEDTKMFDPDSRGLAYRPSFHKLQNFESERPLGLGNRDSTHITIGNLMLSMPSKGIMKWMDIEDKLDRHHLHHDPFMILDLNLSSILDYSQSISNGVGGLVNTYFAKHLTEINLVHRGASTYLNACHPNVH
ncbi:LOW QUALITY PROTEIN: hypothetical protein OSB04_016395 [Centaurea solstitialis]|uniref:F-box domain-containing protein n=1 Tax=Centaurea solstitialis TaxID=347529 RepID=A0AA38WHE0_9ASTR|nr:LOW QUALITY PROTEIN: hypothetical protein OSB04_016395 [Centaurea solstitialis]